MKKSVQGLPNIRRCWTDRSAVIGSGGGVEFTCFFSRRASPAYPIRPSDLLLAENRHMRRPRSVHEWMHARAEESKTCIGWLGAVERVV